MTPHLFNPRPMDHLAPAPRTATTEWLWDGYLARGNLTLLTSVWKAGKTTLLAGLLRQLATGGTFLDRPCRPATAVVASEESWPMWSARLRDIPIGGHVQLASRPFPARPTPEQWDEFIQQAEKLRADGRLDLFVVDSLAVFFPGRSESDPGTLLDLLHPLRRLAAMEAAVLLLHHPRRKKAEAGSTARGGGALLGFVDVILELSRCGSQPDDDCRRKLVGRSRHRETPPSLVYEWTPGTPEFRVVPDADIARESGTWGAVLAALAGRTAAVTHKELLADWPEDRTAPSARQLYEWLGRAAREGLVDRQGTGARNDPYRFRLPAEGR